MLIDSAPPAIITSASPTRMRSAAICDRRQARAQKRLTVTPPTAVRQAGQHARRCARRSCPARASGIAQPMMASSIAFGSSPGTCATRRLDRVRQQVVGPRVAEVAARRLADRRAGRGDDVGVLDLLCSCSSVPSVAHRLAGLQHAHDPFLRLGVHEQRAEVPCARASSAIPRSTSEPASTSPPQHHFGDQARDVEVVRADEAAVAHVDELALDRGDAPLRPATGKRARAAADASRASAIDLACCMAT